MTLSELFQAAIEYKRGSRYSEEDIEKAREMYRQYNHHTNYKPGKVIQMSDRKYVVGAAGNFVRVPE